MRIRANQEMSTCCQAIVESLPEASISADSGYVKGRTITHGSLSRGLWKVSWPILITALCLSIVDLVHVQCAGTLEGNAQAMIGVSDQLMMVCLIIITSFANSGAALVSKAYGAGHTKAIASMKNRIMGLLVVSSIIMLLVLMVLSKVLLANFSGCMDNCSYTIAQGQKYLDLVVFALIPYSIVAAINTTFVGIGNSRIQLLTLFVMTLVDTAMNYLLVIKGWPVAGLGISAIAISSITAYSVATIVALVLWHRSAINKKGKLEEQSDLPRADFIRPLLRVAVPTALQEVAFCGSTFVIFYILSLLHHPAESIAAWTIGQRLEAFAILPLGPLTMAVMVVVGQNVGFGRFERAWKATLGVTGLAFCLLSVAAVALYFFAEPLARISTDDIVTRKILVSYLQIAAFALPFGVLEEIFNGALQALNDCRVPMYISVFFNWIFGLSLSYLLAVELVYGPSGAWMASTITIAIIAIVITMRFLTKSEWRGLSPLAGKLRTVPVAAVPLPVPVEENFADEHISRGKKAQEIELPKDL
ncbi:MATE family efflux transporter [soil metagenome]